MTRQINQRALNLIKEFEGFRADAYRDIAGIWTIGYGTTAAANVGITPHAGMTITKDEAEWYLQKAVNKFAAKVEALLTAPANDNEFGAFVSLAYNIGPGAFAKSSALRNFNAGRKDLAANAILAWNKATVGGRKQVVKGLARRREAEKALFLSRATAAPAKPQAPPTPRKTAPTGKQVAVGGGIAAILAALAAKWQAVEAWFNGFLGG